MGIVLRLLLIFIFIFIVSLDLVGQDKVIKKEIIPTPEEKKKLKDEDPKETTFPTFDNFKKNLKIYLNLKKNIFLHQ
jgi:hypothetical protein